MPTCALDATVGDVRGALDTHPFVLVTDDDGVVIGKLLGRVVDPLEDDERVRDHLIEGPTTVRASEDLVELVARMRRVGTSSVIVTSPGGVLLGALFLDDVPDDVVTHAEHHLGPQTRS